MNRGSAAYDQGNNQRPACSATSPGFDSSPKPRTMSGINRFLSRRDKKPKEPKGAQQEKVMSPPLPFILSTPVSSSASSSRTSSAVSTPFPSVYHHSSSSSLSSLSLAFLKVKAKTSPRLQAVGGTVHASTANASGCYLLQPRQTEGYLNGLFIDYEERVSGKVDDKSVRIVSPNPHLLLG